MVYNYRQHLDFGSNHMEEICNEIPPLPYMQHINHKLIRHDEEHRYAYECPINPQPNSSPNSPTQAYHIHKLSPKSTLSNMPIDPKSMVSSLSLSLSLSLKISPTFRDKICIMAIFFL